MYGTQFVDFIGHYAWVGSEDHITGVEVTEWEEPQAVLGSYLHKYAYPDFFQNHLTNDKVIQKGHSHAANDVNCLQMRGEYLFASLGKKGVRVYDIANIANKGFSQKFVTAPVSPLSQDTHIKSSNATCLVLPTNQPIAPERNQGDLMRITNQEQPFHPLYNYAFVTDADEGLFAFDVNTLVDGDPSNNKLKRAMTWNENGILNGAKHMVLGGYYAYIAADAGLVVVNIDDPLQPKLEAVLPLNSPRKLALQFRYLFVTDDDGLKVIDVTQPTKPKLTDNNVISLADGHGMHLARTYAYVAAGADGIAIIDIKQPESIKLLQTFNADGGLRDSRDITVASTNATLFAYVADGVGGLKVLQLTSPDSQPKFYGFSPEPKPELIASYPTKSPALALSRGLERDRGVDETGGQVAVFGRRGSRPFNAEEMQRMYLNDKGEPWFVTDKVDEVQVDDNDSQQDSKD